MNPKNNPSLWNLYLEYKIGDTPRAEIAKLFNISYPTLTRFFNRCKKIETNQNVFTGIYVVNTETIYVARQHFVGNWGTVFTTPFTAIEVFKNEPNTICYLPNIHEALFLLWRRRYAENEHVRISNAIVIEANTVSVMWQGIIFEKVATFGELNIPFILEAYKPELIIIYDSAKEAFKKAKIQVSFMEIQRNKNFYTAFVTPEMIAEAMANYAAYEHFEEFKINE